MEDNKGDYDAMSDDRLVGDELEMQEDEDGWKLIADIILDRCQHALPQFTRLYPALGD